MLRAAGCSLRALDPALNHGRGFGTSPLRAMRKHTGLRNASTNACIGTNPLHEKAGAAPAEPGSHSGRGAPQNAPPPTAGQGAGRRMPRGEHSTPDTLGPFSAAVASAQCSTRAVLQQPAPSAAPYQVLQQPGLSAALLVRSNPPLQDTMQP